MGYGGHKVVTVVPDSTAVKLVPVGLNVTVVTVVTAVTHLEELFLHLALF
jgi:hypothetical protein